MGSANELSPPINPVWRIILFPSSGQTLSVMKWPQVLPCNPVPSQPSNFACLRGKKGLQCGFNPTQPLLSFSGFVTSHLPPHLTHLHVTSSSPCSRCNFISCTAPLQYLCCRSLSAPVCPHSSLLPSFFCFPSPILPYPLFISLFSKKKKKKRWSQAQAISLYVWWSESGQTPAVKLLLL